MLRDEATIRPDLYRLPIDPLSANVLIPAFRQATSVRGAFGWFSAGWIHTLAAGLAVYLERPDVHPIEFTIAPMLFEPERDALVRAVMSPETAAKRVERELLLAARLDAGVLANHAVDCLTWMVARNRLILKIAIPLPGINYHPKVWIFSDGHDAVAVRGSANATGRAHEAAIEHMDVDCTWVTATRVRVAEAMVDDWSKGKDPVLERTIPLPTALHEHLVRLAPSVQPKQFDYERAIAQLGGFAVQAKQIRSSFSIPAGIEWRAGKYRHQGEAVEAWEASGRHGILAMATGSGKTITALISAYRARQEHEGPFLLVVSAPTSALVIQWLNECKRFGLYPASPSPGTMQGRDTLGHLFQRLRLNKSETVESIVVTNDSLTEASFMSMLQYSKRNIANLKIMFIGDEVHTLGTPSFLDHEPGFIDLRLGLSATPVRQYDEDGTGRLVAYFGDTVYEFGLDQAIGLCLVPYDYLFDVAFLDEEELNKFDELCARIGQKIASVGGFDPRDETLRLLLIRRREILENARSKLLILETVLNEIIDPRYLLIYTSSKNPDQMDSAAAVLDAKGFAYSRVTQAESKDKKKLSKILDSFSRGDIEILLAKKVLDEGVDIPQAREAILLASSTIEREWVQRRGRLLRQAPGKQYATIRDIIALPPPSHIRYDGAILGAISRELDRVRAFGRFARNAKKVLMDIERVHRDYFE
jgi:superfamily II DNA or RNA helicase